MLLLPLFSLNSLQFLMKPISFSNKNEKNNNNKKYIENVETHVLSCVRRNFYLLNLVILVALYIASLSYRPPVARQWKERKNMKHDFVLYSFDCALFSHFFGWCSACMRFQLSLGAFAVQIQTLIQSYALFTSASLPRCASK